MADTTVGAVLGSAPMRLRPALALVAPSGVLAGHAVGHLIAPGHGGHAVDHGYLGPAVAVAAPLALVALALAGATGRHASRRRPPLGALLVAQMLLFGGQEAVEHAAAGHGAGAFLGSPAVWIGLAAQVVTALALVLLLRASAVAGARLAAVVATRATVPGLPVSGRCRAAPSVPLRSRLVTAVASRGPPALSPA